MKPDQLPSFNAAQENPGDIFVEIGTWEGDFSFDILEYTKFKKIFCIDPYKHFTAGEYPDGMNNLSQEDFNRKFDTVTKRFSKFGDRVEFIRLTSEEAINYFENNTIDYLYIDGNHDYTYVCKDIELWFPKIKSGGIICGDDVYSTNLNDHDSDGNIIKVWSYDNSNKPSCWGKYGTYKALVDCSKKINYKYSVDGTQFKILKD